MMTDVRLIYKYLEEKLRKSLTIGEFRQVTDVFSKLFLVDPVRNWYDSQTYDVDNVLMDEAEIKEYEKNDRKCVFIQFDSIKWYNEYIDIQAFEKSLSKLKDGYVFCRMGEENGDIEFRKRTTLPELMKEFEFVKEIRDSLSKELNDEEEEEEFE